MSEDDNFFAMPPSEDPPVMMDGGDDYAMFGGEETGGAPDGYAEFGFAESTSAAAAPEEMDAFAVPASDAVEETPIILGGPPPEYDVMPEDVMEEETTMEPPLPLAPMEPSHMQKWNDEWQLTLNERKETEDAKQVEMETAAKAYLVKFQADKEAKREAKMAKNREDEQAKLEAIEADLENDNSWQRACKMVDLSHDGAAHEGEDVKKMRDILILLKNDVARASAVGA
jgi:Clathrin light chain